MAAGLDRLGDAAPRLQWRHRVGFAPTSHDRRAEQVAAGTRSRQLSAEYNALRQAWVASGFSGLRFR